MSTESQTLPTYFIGHGGVGILFREGQEAVQGNLRDIGKEIQTLRPEAIVITSGHFQSTDQTIKVNVKEQTKVWHDYSFDFHKTNPHVYEYEYPHKASASLAHQVLKHLQSNGIKAEAVERDLDHGVWVPFKLMFPETESPLDIPIVEVSTYSEDDLEAHIQLGKVLSALPGRLLVIGSGMLVHNLAAPRTPDADDGYAKAVEKAALESLAFPAEERKAGLLALQNRADWKLAHPTDDHILPLYVTLGAGLDAKEHKAWSQGLYSVGFSMVSFRLGAAA